MRLIWPQMSHIRPFSFKYHTKIAFCILRSLRGHFPIDLISLQSQGFKTLGSGLSTTLRVVELFLVQNVGLGHSNFHVMGLRPYLSTIPTLNSHFNSHLNSHFLLSKSGNSFLRSGNFSKKNSHFY